MFATELWLSVFPITKSSFRKPPITSLWDSEKFNAQYDLKIQKDLSKVKRRTFYCYVSKLKLPIQMP